jgi:hypothetical protein
MQDALDTALANGKIEAGESARKIRAALAAMAEESKGYEHLFADRLSFVGKTVDDVRQLARARVTEHRAAEERRAAELAERERERIRAEEQAKAQREVEARVAEECRQQEAAAREQRQQQAAPEPAAGRQDVPQQPTPQKSAARILAARRPIAASSKSPTMKLGEINARLAPLNLTADGIAALGFPFAKQEGAAKLWHEHTFPAICDAVIALAARAKLKEAA